MKYLGIDFGTKRIGVSVSDDAGEFAFPKEILTNDSAAVVAIAALVRKEGIAGIVIGHSVASNGAENETAIRVERFKEKLQTVISLPVTLEREDFSTFEAHRYQTDAGHRDDSAAAVILQRFLDKKKK